MEYYSIAIDGPAGSGKSTIAKRVARELNFSYINSGLFYRAIANYVIENRLNYQNQAIFNDDLFKKIKFSWDGTDIFINDELIPKKAFESNVTRVASIIATYPSVREYINRNIQELSYKTNIVVDGRDIGTLVLPHATAKIFLDADVTVRALRRLKQQSSGSFTADMNSIINDIIERDSRDYSRSIAPLAKANDAYDLDCSELTIDETVDKVKRFFMGKVTNANWKD